MLTLLLHPARADTKKQEADKKKQEEKKKREKQKKLEEEKKKREEAQKKKLEAEKKKREAEKKHALKHGTFKGMVLNAQKYRLTIKNAGAKGDWKTLEVDGKTAVSGLGVGSFDKVKKGQIVVAHFTGKHARKLEVVKQAAPPPKLVGKKEHFHGAVEKVVADHYGDTGHIWVKNAKGQTRQFHVHNETTIDLKEKGKKPSFQDLWGLIKKKGEKVKITHVGKEAVHIDFRL
jgi:hypothetical protein